MTNKEKFLEEIEDLVNTALECQEMLFEGLSEDALTYFEKLKATPAEKTDLTEKGRKILDFLKGSEEEPLTAKEIGEGLFTTGRAVSGSLRKLVNDGYVSKDDSNPIKYSLTDAGKEK